MGTESEKLFSIYERIKVAVTSKVEEQKKNVITKTESRTSSAMIFWRNLAHFSTSFFGPLSWTMSLFCDGSGKLIMTWKQKIKWSLGELELVFHADKYSVLISERVNSPQGTYLELL